MAFEVPREAAPAGVEQPEAAPGPRVPMALVPVEGGARNALEAVPESSNGDQAATSPPDDTPPPRGERPKLTRIK